jgi:hypothetical protein
MLVDQSMDHTLSEPFIRYSVYGLLIRTGGPLLISRSKGQVTMDIGIHCPLNISRTLCLKNIKLGTLVDDSVNDEVNKSEVKVQTGHRNILTTQYL